MTFILRNTLTEEIISRGKYPRLDESEPIDSLAENLQYYYQVNEDRPSYDHRTHRLVKSEVWTNDPWNEHNHILIYRISWTTEQLDDQIIIDHLNNELGLYLDETCPMWKRNKLHTESLFFIDKILIQQQVLSQAEQDRMAYIKSIQTWFEQCRAARQSEEDALLADGTLPDFEAFKLAYPVE